MPLEFEANSATLLGQQLSSMLGRRVAPDALALVRPWLFRLLQALELGSVCVDCPDDVILPAAVVGAPGEFKPLIRHSGYLYLARHWQEESAVAASLLRLAQSERPLPAHLDALIRNWFAEGDPSQQAAVRLALSGQLTLIAGGPGTGKTTTVLRLLAIGLAAGLWPQRVQLAAPTGKAAQRLSEAMRLGAAQLPDLAVQAQIPMQAQTIHRLLGIRRDSGRPRYHAQHPLSLDVLVVDEASMIDLGLMRSLLDALPESACLILLGDPEQLAAVEAGNVFADLCHLSAGPVALRVARLQATHRFAAQSGIAQLASAIRADDTDQALQLLQSASLPGVTWLEHQGLPDMQLILSQAQDGFASYCQAVRNGGTPSEVLTALQSFRVLAAVREGATGTVNLNHRIERQLWAPTSLWYPGRVVMVTQNDYAQGLFNGDVGVALLDAEGTLQVWFTTQDGLRAFTVTRLPAHETAFAMTVHKAQGSEFTALLLLLPEVMSPVLERNLIYTALTRARQAICLMAPQSVLMQTLARSASRQSGLGLQLAPPAAA